MDQTLRLTIGLILVISMTACSQPQAPLDAEVTHQAEAPAASLPAVTQQTAQASVAPVAVTSGSMVVYTCEDGGSVTVTYDKHSALVKLSTGSTMLSRAEEGPSPGTDAYLGEELSLYRNGNVVRLLDAGKARGCMETPLSG